MTRDSDDLYVYALAEPGLPRLFTIHGRRLHTVSLEGVDVVAERRAAPDFTTESVRQQHDIVERLSERATSILPARFGSIASASTLQALVSRKRREILDALDAVRGCLQMTIRIFGASAPAPVVASGTARSGTEFMQRLQERTHAVPPEVAVVREAMRRHVEAERIATGERQGLVTVFHLVRRDALDAYHAQASTLQTRLEPHQVTVTGPWPVFAFAPELF